MNDGPNRNTASGKGDVPAEGQAGTSEERQDLEQLRKLLFKPEQERLEHIQTQVARIEESPVPPTAVSRVLPEALHYSIKHDERLPGTLGPAVEKALQASVKRDPKPLADAIFPVIGPAVRKAITDAINSMMQRFQETLQHSVSARGIKWRFEALRTGRPYAEVVMLHTLVYQVEHVFLIHRKNGLLLLHVHAEAAQDTEADMVSGMLTAIQDFMQDSFGGEGGIREVELDDGRTLRVEQGPSAILAAVVRGNTPGDLGILLQEILESIHRDQSRALDDFEGDTEPFEVCRPLLEKCLETQYREGEGKKGVSPWLWFIVVLLILGGISWWGYGVWEQRRWTAYVEAVNAIDGVVVTQSLRQDGRFMLAGMRDPQTRIPDSLLAAAGLEGKVDHAWETYHSFHPPLVEGRARAVLAPPPGVELRLQDGVLYASGEASQVWISESLLLARALPGIVRLDVEGMVEAERAWVAAARRRVEAAVVHFILGQDQPVAGEVAKLDELAEEVGLLLETADRIGQHLQVELAGHTDGSGTEQVNKWLSRGRAQWMRRALSLRGVPAARLQIVGKGPAEPARPENTVEDRAYNRRVTFRVIDGPAR